MDKFLPFVTIDLWTLIFTWVNLIILFLLMKRFFFRPIKQVLKKRDDEINTIYDTAQKNSEVAYKLKNQYEEKMLHSHKEAQEISERAKKDAEIMSKEIISDAKSRADNMILRANEQILSDRKSSYESLKDEIKDISFLIAEKLLERNITAQDNARIVNKIIDDLGK